MKEYFMMKKWKWYHVIAAMIIGMLLNGLLQVIMDDILRLPFYFDSVFTITIGIFFGWIPGVLTGLLTNLFIEAIHGFKGLAWPFAVVNMATGLVAGLIAADKKKYWTLPSQIVMILSLTAVNALLGAFVVNVVYGGLSGSHADVLVSALLLMGQSKVISSVLARIPTNLVDKGIPVMIIFIIYRIWRSRGEAADDLEV